MLPSQLKELVSYCPNSPLIKLNDPWLDVHKVEVFIKRDDLIHSNISGNKFRKLKNTLLRYEQHHNGILSFGGAWSNHLHALSYLTHTMDIPNVAIIRGHPPKQPSDTIKDLMRLGTTIHYVSNEEFRNIRILSDNDQLQTHGLLKQYADYFIIAEGGRSEDALTGVAEIISEQDYSACTALYLACGTGTTLAGLCQGLAEQSSTKVVGIAALKAGDSLMNNVAQLLKHSHTPFSKNWIIEDQYHFGGFAKTSHELFEFMLDIYHRTGLITEPVYTAKALYALYQHISERRYRSGSKIVMLHTGGLQGLRGFKGKGIDELIAVASEASIPYASVPISEMSRF